MFGGRCASLHSFLLLLCLGSPAESTATRYIISGFTVHASSTLRVPVTVYEGMETHLDLLPHYLFQPNLNDPERWIVDRARFRIEDDLEGDIFNAVEDNAIYFVRWAEDEIAGQEPRSLKNTPVLASAGETLKNTPVLAFAEETLKNTPVLAFAGETLKNTPRNGAKIVGIIRAGSDVRVKLERAAYGVAVLVTFSHPQSKTELVIQAPSTVNRIEPKVVESEHHAEQRFFFPFINIKSAGGVMVRFMAMSLEAQQPSFSPRKGCLSWVEEGSKGVASARLYKKDAKGKDAKGGELKFLHICTSPHIKVITKENVFTQGKDKWRYVVSIVDDPALLNNFRATLGKLLGGLRERTDKSKSIRETSMRSSVRSGSRQSVHSIRETSVRSSERSGSRKSVHSHIKT